jgi:hypothetical protein
VPHDKADVNTQLRLMALGLSAEKVGITPLESGVWGAIMDWGMGNGLATLVAFADGTTSLYLGLSGGIIGLQGHAGVRQAARLFLEVASRFVDTFVSTTDYPMPAPEHTRFYIHTMTGVKASPEIDVKTLAPGKPGISELFGAAQNVITQIRLSSEQKGGST